jgi:tetraacyldisaccharide 4'-kinase
MREPSFWWSEAGIVSGMLAPLAALYGTVAAARLDRRGARAGAPVVCVGNLTVGGAGKTPTALELARMLATAGERPVFLTRGYGGRLPGPVQADPARHGANDVGDEPLLLARTAPTIVARDRVAGARMAVAVGASVIVMDDGFQNPSLVKDFSVLVVDARRAIGSGRVIPAGPLRAPLATQLAHAHAMLVVGAPPRPAAITAAAHERHIPLFGARLVPDADAVAELAGRRVLAFAGIGDPQKFFATLVEAGIAVATERSFPDHHRYTGIEARTLCDDAERAGVALVTTEKDIVRLAGDAGTAQLAKRAHALPVKLAIDQAETFKALLVARIGRRRTGDT